MAFDIIFRAKRTRPEGPSSRSEFSVFRDARFHKLKAEVSHCKIPLFFDHAAKKSVKNCYHFETSSFQGAPTNFRLVYVFRLLQRMIFGFKNFFSKIDRKLPEISRLKKSEIFCIFHVIQLIVALISKSINTLIYNPNLMKLCMWIGIGK